MKIALGIEYDGTAYSGWQRQKNGPSVQERVEQALASIANEPVAVVCAGRTDAGVHALGQVAHFETRSRRSDRGWLLGANSNLPDDIAITWVRPVTDAFHARFSATARSYRYLILNRLARSALHRQRAWWIHRPLEAGRMHRAAQCLVGEHDFSAFRAAGCQAKAPTRNVFAVSVSRNDDWVSIDICANAFLQHMVRNITGTLVAIGLGDETEGWIADVLASRNRTAGGMAAPSHGLTLLRIDYPDEYSIPAPSTYGALAP